MAEKKKYKLGDYEFDTEQEYREAAIDLKRIKELMAKYDVSNPDQARRILATILAHPESFRSPYGRKFVDKLEKSVGRQNTPVPPAPNMAPNQIEQPLNRSTQTGNAVPYSEQNTPAEKSKKTKEKHTREKPARKKKGESASGGIQIFTVRNFIIGIIIIAGIVIFSIYGPKLFSFDNDNVNHNSDIKRTMITSYAKNQAELKAQLYTYYYNVVGRTEEEAKKDAETEIGKYALNLSDTSVSSMTDSEITDAYDKLVEGGDIQNNSFVEPAEISAIKEKLAAAGISGNTANGADGETAVTAAVSNMMLYQERIYYSLCHNYELLDFSQEDSKAFANDDMTAMFGNVIFQQNMNDEDKQSNFEFFQKRGLIKDNKIVRFSTDPTAYNLPELTPAIELTLKKEKAKAYQCSMINYAPAASVFYEFHANGETGYLCFRNNSNQTKYVQLDADTSVTVQGDFFMANGSEIVRGEWFYNKQDIGLLIDGDQSSKISYVHDLTY